MVYGEVDSKYICYDREQYGRKTEISSGHRWGLPSEMRLPDEIQKFSTSVSTKYISSGGRSRKLCFRISPDRPSPLLKLSNTNMSDSKGKLVLVTGGAGFIGSHLCERLVKEGNRVISLDNYFAGSALNHVEGVEYRTGHTKDIAKYIFETPDIIYHLGEYSRVAKSLEEPGVVFDLNILGTFGVLEFWREKKCKLVYAGSSTKHVGEREDGVLGRDLSPYTWMKAANSELVVNYGRWYDLPYAVVYFYNVYGPRERSIEEYGTVIETWRRRMLEGKLLPVREPGTQMRAFTHVLDTVEGIVLVGEKGEGDNYGIGTDEAFSLLDVAHMFGGEIEMLPQTESSRTSPNVDSEKVRALGWVPKQHLQDYIQDYK